MRNCREPLLRLLNYWLRAPARVSRARRRSSSARARVGSSSPPESAPSYSRELSNSTLAIDNDKKIIDGSREAATPDMSDASNGKGDDCAMADRLGDSRWFQGVQIEVGRTGFCLVNGRGGCTYATCAAVIAELSRASARGGALRPPTRAHRIRCLSLSGLCACCWAPPTVPAAVPRRADIAPVLGKAIELHRDQLHLLAQGLEDRAISVTLAPRRGTPATRACSPQPAARASGLSPWTEPSRRRAMWLGSCYSSSGILCSRPSRGLSEGCAVPRAV